MKKCKKEVIIFCGLTLVFLTLLILSVAYPMKKPYLTNEIFDKQVNLIKNRIYRKNLDVNGEKLDGLVFYTNSPVKDIELNVKVYSNNVIFYENTFTELNNYENRIIFKNSLDPSEKVSVFMELKNISGTNKITLLTDQNNQIGLKKVANKKSYRSSFWLLVGFVVCLFIFLKKLFNGGISFKKWYSFLLYYFVYFSCSFLASMFLFKMAYNGYFCKGIVMRDVFLLLIFILAVVFMATRQLNSKKIELEKIFLVMIIPISSMYCVFCMPEDEADGWIHYARPYYTATSGLIVENREFIEVPTTIISKDAGFRNSKELIKTLKKDTDYTKVKKETNVAKDVNVLIYFFSTIGIFTAKFFRLNAYYGWYLAKLLNLVFYVVMGYFSIKLIPKFKLASMLYLMMPMSLYIAGSISPDSMINPCLLFMIAYLLHLKEEKNISYWAIIPAFIFGGLGIAYRICYLPILFFLMLLCVNWKKLISKNNLVLILMFVSIFIIPYGWNFYNRYVVATKTFSSFNSINGGLEYVLYHPLNTLTMLWNNLIESPNTYILDAVGQGFVWLTEFVPYFYPACYLMILIVAALVGEKKENYSVFEKMIFALIFLSSAALIYVAMYLLDIHSNVMIGKALGVQGRYFIPMLIFILFTFEQVKIDKKDYINLKNTLCICCICIHVLYIFNLLKWTIT